MKQRQPKAVLRVESGLPETGDFGKPNRQSRHSLYGTMGGRPRVEVDLARARDLLSQLKSIKAIARELGVGEGTLRRALGPARVGGGPSDAPTPRQKPGRGAL